MIGLMKKDFYILWHAYRKNLALVLVLYTVMAIAMNASFMMFLFSWITGFYIIGSLSMDNYSKWDLYAVSLPVSKKQIVGAKFLLIAIAQILSFVLSAVICLLLTLLQGQPLLENLISSAVVCFFCLVYFGMTFALAYRFGVEKSRTAMLLVAMGIFVLLMAAANFGLFDALAVDPTLQWLLFSDPAPLVLTIGFPVVCVALYLLCWGISTAIYSRKEF